MSYNISPLYKIQLIDLSDNTSVAAAGTNTQTLQPPVGKVYEVINIYYYAPDPSGSASGTHKIEIQPQNMTSFYSRYGLVQGNTGTNIFITAYGHFVGDSELPSTAALQWDLTVNGILKATNSSPIDFKYTNSTDVAQAATRVLELRVKEYNELG